MWIDNGIVLQTESGGLETGTVVMFRELLNILEMDCTKFKFMEERIAVMETVKLDSKEDVMSGIF